MPNLSFFSELKRRNVFRVALAYLVVGWLALQVADVLVDALELPALWSKALIALLAIGFLPVLVFAWVYEMTPEGLKKESEVTAEASITAHTARKLNLAIIVLLVLAIGLFAADRFMGRPVPVQAPPPAAEAAPGPASEVPVVAVLPLKALSTDQEGTFLASGLHDDLLTRLAKLQAFKVISRTSVMEYADTVKNIRQIGEELGAGFIVEGGLQSIGGRVSINAQLIDAATDEHLWAETFNRALTTANLFEVQGEIAGAIAGALHATLSPTDQAQLAERPTDNLDAYRAYLRGLETASTLTAEALNRTESAFREAVALDPEFADAWAKLAVALIRRYWEEGGESDAQPDESLRGEARLALERARALAPEALETLLAEAYYQYYAFRDYSAALIILGKAEAIAPHHDMVIALRGFLLRRLGRLDEAADALLRSVEANPASSGHIRETTTTLRVAGRCDEAVAMGRNGLARYPDHAGILYTAAWSELMCNRDAEASYRLTDQVEITTRQELWGITELLVHVGRPESAIERLNTLEGPLLEDPVMRLSVANHLAWLYRATGQAGLADDASGRAAAEAARLEPTGAAVLSHLAFSAALRGDAEAALAYGQRMLAEAPNDAFIRDRIYYDAVRAWAIAGATNEALEQLEALLGLPYQSRFLALADTDPYLAPLHDDPRFATILAGRGR